MKATVSYSELLSLASVMGASLSREAKGHKGMETEAFTLSYKGRAYRSTSMLELYKALEAERQSLLSTIRVTINPRNKQP